jgi:hypothetical protein
LKGRWIPRYVLLHRHSADEHIELGAVGCTRAEATGCNISSDLAVCLQVKLHTYMASEVAGFPVDAAGVDVKQVGASLEREEKPLISHATSLAHAFDPAHLIRPHSSHSRHALLLSAASVLRSSLTASPTPRTWWRPCCLPAAR